MGAFSRIFSWLLRKFAFAALLAGLGLVGVGLRIFLHEPGDFASQQQQIIQALTAENVRLKALIAEADHRMQAKRVEIPAQQLRAQQAARVARELDDLGSGLNWFSTSSAQLESNNQRSAQMKQMETDSLKRVADLGQNLVRIQWEKDGMEIALERNRARLATAIADNFPLLHYARLAWANHGKLVLAAVTLLMLGPAIWRVRRAG